MDEETEKLTLKFAVERSKGGMDYCPTNGCGNIFAIDTTLSY
jgi:hypothetical protein